MSLPARYHRNMQALSESECHLLAKKKVAVIGCGGLGGYCMELLARMGVGYVRVVDGDSFEESNLNRQLLATAETMGERKVNAAVHRIGAINDLVAVESVDCLLNEKNAVRLVSSMDCVLDCLDNFESRFWLAHACQESGVPLIYGAIAGWFGQVCTVFPGDVSFVDVYSAFEGGAESQHTTLGNLAFTAAATASVMASEATKVLLCRGEVLRNRLMMIDLLDGSIDDLPLG